VAIALLGIALTVGAGSVIALHGRPDFQSFLVAAGATSMAKSVAAGPTGVSAPPVVEFTPVVTRKIVEWQEYTGRFEAVDEVDVRARVSGYLDAVHFKPGQRVAAGEKLFTIDQRPFKATVAEAEARLAQAQSAVHHAVAEFERTKKLAAQGHASQSVLETRQQEADAARAAVGVAEAQLRRANLDLGFTIIHAPVSGRISDERITPGNLIEGGANSPILTTIVSISPIHFFFDATEQQLLSRLRATGGASLREKIAGAKVQVRLIDEDEFEDSGTVDFVDNRIDEGTGTIRGRAVFDNRDEIFTPGMFGRLRLAEPELAEVALIPDKAIGTDQTQKFVWVLDQEDKARRRVIVTGQKRGDMRIVKSGLKDGERVITSGLHRVASGRQVTPKPTQIAGAAVSSVVKR
jgi:RND family efflux transporter MFP subunit